MIAIGADHGGYKLKEETISDNSIEEENELLNDEKIEEAISALQVLGYGKREIERVIEKFELKDMTLEDIIKEGLKYLAK